MKKASATQNYIYNTLYKVLSLLTPLITAPYLARVIDPEGVGTFSYTYAIAYNFSLVAKLGLISYGSRSIAKARDDKERLARVFSEIYMLQILTTAITTIAYLIFVTCYVTDYKNIFYINILYVIGIAIDIDWLFYGLENFKMTAIRNAIIKALTVVAIILFVKTRQDLVKYVFIMGAGEFLKYASIWISFKSCTKFISIRIKNVLLHLKPTIILFIPVIATSVYRSMDKVMLGAMTSMAETGIYENSEKIVYMLLGFVTSLEVVMMPKISNLLENGKEEEAYENISKSMTFVVALTSAMAFGIIGIMKNFVPWFYGDEFLGCIKLLPILSLSLCFIGWANVIRTQYIVPRGEDHIYVISTIIGAILNLILNLICIPRMGALGATIGTFVAELSVAVYLSVIVRKELPILQFLKKTLYFPVLGVLMAFIVYVIGIATPGGLTSIFIQIMVGCILYTGFCLIYLKIVQKDMYRIIILKIQMLFKRKTRG